MLSDYGSIRRNGRLEQKLQDTWGTGNHGPSSLFQLAPRRGWIHRRVGPQNHPGRKEEFPVNPEIGACCPLHEGGPEPNPLRPVQSPFTPQPHLASARHCCGKAEQMPRVIVSRQGSQARPLWPTLGSTGHWALTGLCPIWTQATLRFCPACGHMAMCSEPHRGQALGGRPPIQYKYPLWL